MSVTWKGASFGELVAVVLEEEFTVVAAPDLVEGGTWTDDESMGYTHGMKVVPV